jgi:D-alanyl-D-alanine carboxypeptidase
VIVSAQIAGDIESTSGPDDLLVPWWSFAKAVLAASAFRLAQERRLELDAALPGKPFTVRQLLAHRAGVPDYGGLADYHAAVARGDDPWPVDELLSRTHADQLLFAPGHGWSYSNIGYLFVRRQIEKVTNGTLDAALRETIFAPLAIGSARLATESSGAPWLDALDYNPGWVYHGLIVGTALDAARLLHRLFTSDFLTPQSRTVMLDSVSLPIAVPDRPFVRPTPGTGLMIDPKGPQGFWAGHTGGGPGSVAAVYHFRDLVPPRTVAAFANDLDEGGIERAVLALAAA